MFPTSTGRACAVFTASLFKRGPFLRTGAVQEAFWKSGAGEGR